jgi:hypothetical protein
MSHEVLVPNRESAPASDTAIPAKLSPAESLDRVVATVKRDSGESPASYLAETVVPHGGE